MLHPLQQRALYKRTKREKTSEPQNQQFKLFLGRFCKWISLAEKYKISQPLVNIYLPTPLLKGSKLAENWKPIKVVNGNSPLTEVYENWKPFWKMLMASSSKMYRCLAATETQGWEAYSYLWKLLASSSMGTGSVSHQNHHSFLHPCSLLAEPHP